MSTLALDPAEVLFGKTRRRVLDLLLSHPDESFYLREIVRRTEAAQGAVQRELDLLTRAGILRRTRRGRQVHFQVEPASPILPELRALFEKTAGFLRVLRDSLELIADRIDLAFVFGSAARGALRPGSDLDLFVVGSATFQEVVEAVAPAQRRLGREVNPVVYPPEELRARLARGDHFLRSLLVEPRVLLLGSPDEFERMGAERLADAAPDEPTGDPRSSGARRPRPGGQRR